MNARRPSVLLMLTIAAASARWAPAADHPVPGVRLVMVRKYATGEGKAIFVAKDPAIVKGTASDPSQIEANLDLVWQAFRKTGLFAMPQGSHWIVNDDRSAKYVNAAAPVGGAVKSGVIKQGVLLKVVGKSPGDEPLDIFGGSIPGVPFPIETSPVFAALTIRNGADTERLCMQFSSCLYREMLGGQKLRCTAGTTDPYCRAGCGRGSARFVDLGTTVRDDCTNLEWEKKDGVTVDERYTWAGFCTLDFDSSCQPDAAAAATCAAFTGGAEGCAECGVGQGTCDVDQDGASTTVWDWINELNASNYAGHSDWRLPTVAGNVEAFDPSENSPTGEAPELEQIYDADECMVGTTEPCIAPAFGSTAPWMHWSGVSASPTDAWAWRFGPFDPGTNKHSAMAVRAVRGGS